MKSKGACRCNPPIDPPKLPHPSGKKPIGVEVKTIPELEFPRKLENCVVDIRCGAYHSEHVTTDEFEIWLLSPSSIKISDGERIWEKHNVSIEFSYPKEE